MGHITYSMKYQKEQASSVQKATESVKCKIWKKKNLTSLCCIYLWGDKLRTWHIAILDILNINTEKKMSDFTKYFPRYFVLCYSVSRYCLS